MSQIKGMKSAFGCVMIFFIILLSYSPLKTEIHDVATNETLTNAIYVFLDAWFGLFWSMFAVMFLGLAVWIIWKD